MSDREVAEKHCCTSRLISVVRRRLGIQPFHRGPKPTEKDWATVEKDLGVLADSEIAKRLGVLRSTVTTHRNKICVGGCKVVDRRTRINWNKVNWKLTDKAIAIETGANMWRVKQWRDRVAATQVTPQNTPERSRKLRARGQR